MLCSFSSKTQILHAKISYINVQVNVSHYRPEQVHRAPGVLRLPEFLDNRYMKMERLWALSTGRLYLLVLICVKGWVHPKAIVRPVGLSQWETPMTPSGIKPAIILPEAECISQLRHLVPLAKIYHFIFSEPESQHNMAYVYCMHQFHLQEY
jgi:hypothetical protein